MTERTARATGPATIYDEHFVPALFGPWADRIADLARLKRGDRVLDVACGTGVLARAAAKRIGPDGAVVGLDIDEGMLAVARRKAPQIEWRQGDAQSLPFEDASFDAVVSQFGLMFFRDRERAIREMLRVLKRGGGLTVAVWEALERTPPYLKIVEMLRHHFGDDVADILRMPFNLGEPEELRRHFDHAGATEISIQTQSGHGRFPSIRDWMATDIRGWVEFKRPISDEELESLIADAEGKLAEYRTTDGRVEFPIAAHIVTASRGR